MRASKDNVLSKITQKLRTGAEECIILPLMINGSKLVYTLDTFSSSVYVLRAIGSPLYMYMHLACVTSRGHLGSILPSNGCWAG